MPDVDIYPRATATAAETVNAHQNEGHDIVFYSGWFCPFVQRVWFALEEKEIPYQYKEENPYHKDKDFLEVSPKGLVPALKYKGKALNESLVILEFLEDAYPDRPLLPKDPYLRARVRLAVDHVSKAVVPAFYRLLQAQTTEGRDSARNDLYTALNTFGSQIQGPFWAGDQLTLADISLTPWIVRLYILEKHRGFQWSEAGSAFKAWAERILERPSLKRTISDLGYLEQTYERYLRDESQSEVAKATRAGKGLP